jgi:hypothetical protein
MAAARTSTAEGDDCGGRLEVGYLWMPARNCFTSRVVTDEALLAHVVRMNVGTCAISVLVSLPA